MIISRLGLLSLGFFLSIGFAVPSDAGQSDSTTVGRYLTVQNKASPGQTDLLNQTFQLHFPHSVKTIKEAVNYLLQFSGYTLVSDNHLPMAARSLLAQPLPAVDRSLGPLSLREGLLTLVGRPFGLLFDPVHRLISFYLMPTYSPVYQANSSKLFFKNH